MNNADKQVFRKALVETIPHLRRYARILARNREKADDLVQECLLKGWENRESLSDLNKLRPWLFTILRNGFYASRSQSNREVEDVNGDHAARLSIAANQTAVIDLVEVLFAVNALPAAQREALMLVCVEELSYQEAADICRCNVGTLKSRINRARARLIEDFGLELGIVPANAAGSTVYCATGMDDCVHEATA